jgi:hypothetical protein
LVLDTKGDMMGGLPTDGDPLLVAPHDRRSFVWDVAADCSIKQDARAFPPASFPRVPTRCGRRRRRRSLSPASSICRPPGQGLRLDHLETVVTADIEQLTTEGITTRMR